MPLSENEAATGIVPYIHNGEAIPKIHAGIIPNIRKLFLLSEAKILLIQFLQNTDTNEPIAIPKSQY